MLRLSFRGRLFLLLLVFAAVPVVLMTWLGYYLVASVPSQDATGDGTAGQRLGDYYADFVFTDLRERLATFRTDGAAAGLDFAFVYDDDTVVMLDAATGFPVEAARQVGEAARLREQGLTEAGGRLCQYVATPTHRGGIVVAGIVHDSSLVALIDELKTSGARSTTRRELRARYVVFVGGLFLSITVLTLLAAWYFSARVSRRLAGPLTALSRASERIARGDFKETVDIAADGEIGTLVDSFNRMVLRLDEATARLAQTERVAAWRQVARRFAHELKNPLQPILVSLYRIEKQLAETPQWELVREPLQAASEEVRHLTELAERFSGLAKLPPPRIATVDLKQIARSVAELYREKLRPFDFSVELPEGDVVVPSDESYLREAVHNLLQNAADACHEGDGISLRVTEETDRVLLAVADGGPGMDASTLASARLPYFTTKQKGSGLGLALVDKFMTELGGRLRVESQPGAGTTVTLVLPKESNHAS